MLGVKIKIKVATLEATTASMPATRTPIPGVRQRKATTDGQTVLMTRKPGNRFNTKHDTPSKCSHHMMCSWMQQLYVRAPQQ